MNQEDLQAFYEAVAPVTDDLVSLVESSLQPYAALRDVFFKHLAEHIHPPGMQTLLEQRISPQLFAQDFCEQIPLSLRALRRVIIRMEDVQQQSLHSRKDAPPADSPLETLRTLEPLIRLAERVEALYQRHWEFHRYQERIPLQELLHFVLEVDAIYHAWRTQQGELATLFSLLRAGEGAELAQDEERVQIFYRPPPNMSGSLELPGALLCLVQAAHRFIAAALGDPEMQSLRLVRLLAGAHTELHIAVQTKLRPVFVQFLQNLFLKDLLKREALIKVLFEVVRREAGSLRMLSPAETTRHHRELLAELKRLPAAGELQIAEQIFPRDRFRVLQSFISRLEAQGIRYAGILEGKHSNAGKRPSTKPRPATFPLQGKSNTVMERSSTAPASDSTQRIGLLTEDTV